MEAYLTDTDGITGCLRARLEDFVVEEIPLGFSSIEEFTSMSLARSPSRYENVAVCLLEKRGIDTFRAASIVAERLNLKVDNIGFGGLKDAKAATKQLVSLPWKQSFQRKYEFPEGIMLTVLGFSYRPLALGELFGNQFSVIARKISLDREELRVRIEEVSQVLREKGGFPAYFGYQRFGSRRPISHLIGRNLAFGDCESAVKLLLTGSTPSESDATRNAREKLAAEEDYEAAAGYFPEFLGIERRLVNYLRKRPRDFDGALKSLPLRLRRLFLDAYQSFIYNKALSLRLRERTSPTEIRPGDLVASIDNKGYTQQITKASSKNQAKINEEVESGKVTPVLAILLRQNPSSSQPISPEVISVLDDELKIAESKAGGTAVGELVRPILGKAEDLGWIIGDDEVNLGYRRADFYFRLSRGFYATVLLREFVKPTDPLAASF